jgi:hypothetical protein
MLNQTFAELAAIIPLLITDCKYGAYGQRRGKIDAATLLLPAPRNISVPY